MTAALPLLVVDPPAPLAAALDGRADVDPVYAAPDGVAAAVEAAPPAAAVVAGGATLGGAAVTALDAAGAPVVAFADEPPTESYVAGFVAATAEPVDRLLREVEHALAGETRLQLAAARDRTTRLHEGAARIAAAETVEGLFDRTAGVIADVLSFDHAWLGVREGDEFVAKLGRSRGREYPDRVPLDHGVVGRTHRTGEPVVVRDASGHDCVADPRGGIGSFVSVPVGGYGVLQAGAARPNAFDECDRDLAALLGTHVAEAYGRLRAETTLRRDRRRVTDLNGSVPVLVDADTEAELFDTTVGVAERVLSFDRSYLLRWTGGSFVAVAGTDDDLPERLPKRGVLGRTFDERRTIVVDDARTDPDARPVHPETRSAIGVPLGDDVVFQALSAEPAAFDDTDRELAELLVAGVASVRERVRSATALRESRAVIERLHAAAADVAAADTEAGVIDRAVAAAEGVLSFDTCTIMLREGETLHPAGDSAGSPPDGSRPMHVSEGIAGRTARTGEPVLVEDVAGTPTAEPARAEYRSGISVPVGGLGVFQAVGTTPGAFDDDDVHRAELLMAHAAAALERVRAQTDRRAEHDRLSALFENMPDAAVAFELVDGEPVVREVNDSFEADFGYAADEIVGESLDEHVVPPERADEAADLNRRLRQGEVVRKEVRRLTPDGVSDFMAVIVPLTIEGSNVGGYVIYPDISVQKERERGLERQNERLDEFASVVSHDLRNPLSIADGYLDLARETGDDDHLRTVEDAIERMRTLVDDVLALAREGRIVGEPEPVALDRVAERAWRSVDTAGATLDAAGAEGVTVSADPERLRELLENLFRNAVEHAGDGVTVGVAATQGGFAVADDGPGVPPDERERVFDPGYTTADDGTGFGLPIVRRIAEAHAWRVGLTEGDRGGARFTFDL